MSFDLLPQEQQELLQFLAGNFHQDWDLDFPTPLAILEDFKSGISQPRLQTLLTALRKLINSSASEKELADFLLFQCYCPFDYSVEWGSAKNWVDFLYKNLLG